MATGMNGTTRRSILRHLRSVVEHVEDTLVQEQCLRIILDNEEVGRTMCTPGQEHALVVGYLYTEGLIHSPGQLADLSLQAVGPSTANTLEARVVQTRLPQRDKPLASCRRLDRCQVQSAVMLAELMQHMEAAQVIFKRTGATHCSALYTAEGRLLSMAEDIGRHNALDKVIGQALLQGTLPKAALGFMSSRLSHELVLKAAAAGLTFLCGISVATSLAVDAAQAKGITLVGRIRGPRMNVYTRKERVGSVPEQTGQELRQPLSA